MDTIIQSVLWQLKFLQTQNITLYVYIAWTVINLKSVKKFSKTLGFE